MKRNCSEKEKCDAKITISFNCESYQYFCQNDLNMIFFSSVLAYSLGVNFKEAMYLL